VLGTGSRHTLDEEGLARGGLPATTSAWSTRIAARVMAAAGRCAPSGQRRSVLLVRPRSAVVHVIHPDHPYPTVGAPDPLLAAPNYS